MNRDTYGALCFAPALSSATPIEPLARLAPLGFNR
jgi:hypothetical protein